MAIIATSNGGGQPRELTPAGNHVAVCYSMIHIGTIEENIQGTLKKLNKVRIGWELTREQREFDGVMKPLVISKEFSLSLHEKATLRQYLKSWRGVDFTEEQAKSFDITCLTGVPCMINIVHKQSKDGTKTYAEVATLAPMPKGFDKPAQINPTQLLMYDDFDWSVFDKLPDFLKEKVRASEEYAVMARNTGNQEPQETFPEVPADAEPLPF